MHSFKANINTAETRKKKDPILIVAQEKDDIHGASIVDAMETPSDSYPIRKAGRLPKHYGDFLKKAGLYSSFWGSLGCRAGELGGFLYWVYLGQFVPN